MAIVGVSFTISYQTAVTGDVGVSSIISWLPSGIVPGQVAVCCDSTASPFTAIRVAHRAVGGTVVTWEFVAGFAEAGPYTFSLEWSSVGTPGAADWQQVGLPATDPAYMIDPTQRIFGTVNLSRYRLVLTTAVGQYTSGIGTVEGVLGYADILLATDIVRKEKLRYIATTAGVYGYLLPERRYGTLCTSMDPISMEHGDSYCLTCFSRNYIDGYHPAVPCWYADPSAETLKKMIDMVGGRGNVADNSRFARMLADYPITTNDLWVNHYSDERYRIISTIDEVAVRDVTLVYGVTMAKLPQTDIAYRVPVTRTVAPTLNCSVVTPAEPICIC